MGEVGELVARLDHLRRARPAPRRCRPPARDRRRRAGGELAVLRHDLLGAARLGRGLVPLHGDRVAPLAAPPTCARRPPRARAASPPRRRRPASPSPPPRRTTPRVAPNFGGWIIDRGQHARQLHVDGEGVGAVGLRRRRRSGGRSSLPISVHCSGCLQRHLGRHRHRGRRARRARRSRRCRRSDASACPSATVISAAGTPHCSAAAATSIARAVAPAWR